MVRGRGKRTAYLDSLARFRTVLDGDGEGGGTILALNDATYAPCRQEEISRLGLGQVCKAANQSLWDYEDIYRNTAKWPGG